MLWASLHNPQKGCNNTGILSDCLKILWAWEINQKQPFMVVFSCLHFLKRTFYRALIEYKQPPHIDFVSPVKWLCLFKGTWSRDSDHGLISFVGNICWAAEHAETFSKHCPGRRQSLMLFLGLESSGPVSAALSTSETCPFWWWTLTQGSWVSVTASVNGSSHGHRGLFLYINHIF